ncbi:hypothetical protein GCM10022414_36000 [Zhongshania borealis]|uniref:Uncharacterized protein n=1 Tax=Zhongshania borealis TaxID=889488 RepID=A0ABP7X6N7_9GAMM
MAKSNTTFNKMVADFDDSSNLPSDIPSLKSHTPPFYIKLLLAWIKMEFKNPKVEVSGNINS